MFRNPKHLDFLMKETEQGQTMRQEHSDPAYVWWHRSVISATCKADPENPEEPQVQGQPELHSKTLFYNFTLLF